MSQNGPNLKVKNSYWGKSPGEVKNGCPDIPSDMTNYPAKLNVRGIFFRFEGRSLHLTEKPLLSSARSHKSVLSLHIAAPFKNAP